MRRLSLLSALAGAMLFTTGCYNSTTIRPTVKDTDAYLAAHADLSDLDKRCIEDGSFEVGMSGETVRFMLGEPKTIEIVKQPWATQQKLIYNSGKDAKVFYIEDKGVVAIEDGN